ncbi:CMTA1 protein, partial [Polypterus senegalus]
MPSCYKESIVHFVKAEDSLVDEESIDPTVEIYIGYCIQAAVCILAIAFVWPQNGSMILYNRKKVKYRKDGYCWKKRKDGKTTREDHMKLKVQGVEEFDNSVKEEPPYCYSCKNMLHAGKDHKWQIGVIEGVKQATCHNFIPRKNFGHNADQNEL